MALGIDFAFEGFRIIAKRPVVIPIWGLVLFIGNLIAFGLFAVMAIPAFSHLSATPSTDPTQVMALFSQLAVPYILLLVCMILTQSIISCAIYRLVLGAPNTGFGYVRVGVDELRNVGINVVFAILFLILYFGCVLAGTVVGGLLSLILGAISKSIAPVGIFVGIVAGVIAMIWILTRLSLAPVQSFDQKRFNLFGSWSITKGHAWTLFFGYFIAAIVAIVLYFVSIIVFGGITAAMGAGSAMQGAAGANPAQVESMLMTMIPAMLVFVLFLSLIVMPLMVALMVGGPAAAYKALSGTTTSAAEMVF